MHTKRTLLLAILLALLTVITTMTQAQNTPILTIALQEFTQDTLDSAVFDAFEAQYGVDVVAVAPGNRAFFTENSGDIDDHLNEFAQYAGFADVLPLNWWQLSTEATRAGYLLDLLPLTNTDPTFDPNFYNRAALAGYEWDGGLWALPSSFDMVMIDYLPAVLDAAGLAYPNGNWTLNDLENAARALTVYDAQGNVVTPGMWMLYPPLLVRALVGSGFYDMTQFPNTPDFSNPAISPILDRLAALVNEGVIATTGIDPAVIPLRVGSIGSTQNQPERAIAPLPNNSSAILGTAYAVSGGTAYPELAYALVNYISTNPAFRATTFDAFNPQGQSATLTPEQQMIVDTALPNAFGFSEVRFGWGVNSALRQAINGTPSAQALQSAQDIINQNLLLASDRAQTPLVVQNSALQAQGDGIVLNFGIGATVFPLPNEAQWQALVDDFVATDPDVTAITLNPDAITPDQFAAENDCFYTSSGAINALSPGSVIALNPFLDADPTFNPSAMIGGVMNQMQRDGQTLALPTGIAPAVLWYNTDTLTQIGVNINNAQWAINDFDATLRSLDAPVFLPMEAGNTPLLMLAAAYGGLPLDTTTSPPTINFTDPAAIDALRQVLDLAKSGHIAYRELSNAGMGGGLAADPNTVALHTDRLGALSYRLGEWFGNNAASGNYAPTTYPQGVYTPVSYTTRAGFISAETPYREACYRWLTTIAQNPQTFNLMPVSRDILNDPAYTATQDAVLLSLYTTFDTLTQQPNTVVFPMQFGTGIGTETPAVWLNRALDNYVLRDADLEMELAQAQSTTIAYRDCYNAALNGDPATFDAAIDSCVASIDSTLSG